MIFSSKDPWRVSLHGGHSNAYCDHASSTLEEMIEAAIAAGYHTFGVTEHAPRLDARFLYPEETALGWDVARIAANFERYAVDVHAIADRFEDRITILRGFETESAPAARYLDIMRDYRTRYPFDYMVGSIHYVDDFHIDGRMEDFERAVAHFGSFEALATRYYRVVAEMVDALQPQVVGHLDLIRKNAPAGAVLDSPAIREAVGAALESIRRHDAILDINTAGYRKGLGSPYPQPWIIREAHAMGIGLCFGDDSHAVHDVGAGLEAARLYLIDNGISTISVFRRAGGGMVRYTASLT